MSKFEHYIMCMWEEKDSILEQFPTLPEQDKAGRMTRLINIDRTLDAHMKRRGFKCQKAEIYTKTKSALRTKS